MCGDKKKDHEIIDTEVSRRKVLAGGLAVAAATGAVAAGALSAPSAQAADDPYAPPARQ